MLDEGFPEDKSVGFANGEFRGSILQEVASEESEEEEVTSDKDAMCILIRECRECHQKSRHRGARFLRNQALSGEKP